MKIEEESPHTDTKMFGSIVINLCQALLSGNLKLDNIGFKLANSIF